MAGALARGPTGAQRRLGTPGPAGGTGGGRGRRGRGLGSRDSAPLVGVVRRRGRHRGAEFRDQVVHRPEVAQAKLGERARAAPVAGGTGLDGQPVPDPNPQSLGLGGDGEASGLVCTAADPAVDGSDGEDGARYDTLAFPQ